MKAYLVYILFFLFIYPVAGFSQMGDKKQNLFIYGEVGMDGGNYSGPKLALNWIWKDNIITTSYNYVSRDAKNIPSDYIAPLITFTDGKPRQHVSVLSLMYGKVLFSNYPGLRFVLKGGVTAGVVETPGNYRNVPSSWFPYSTFDYNNQSTAGIVLDPAIEFPCGAGFGFSVDAFANINSVSSYAGVGANMIFGKVRNRTRTRRKHLHQ